jgi:hypothetical protein
MPVVVFDRITAFTDQVIKNRLCTLDRLTWSTAWCALIDVRVLLVDIILPV